MREISLPAGRVTARTAPGRARPLLNLKSFLSLLLLWDLLRASGMWFGYPSAEEEFGSVDPFAQQILLYAMVPAIGAYVFLDFPFLLMRLRRIPWLIWFLIAGLLVSVLFSLAQMASFRALIATAIITLPPVLCFWRTGAQNTYHVVRKFCLFAIFANFAYWMLFPGTAIMTGVLAGSLRGLFIHKNFFAQFMAEALIFVVPETKALRRGNRTAVLCCLATLLDLAMIVKSHSATAILLVAMAGAAYVSLRFISRIRFRLARALMLAWAAFLGLVVYLVFADGLLDTITAALGKDPTLTGRTKLWQVLYQISLQRPWTGAGFGVYRLPSVMADLAPYFGWQARSTHNTYLELVLTVGYPTTILFGGLLLMSLLRKVMTMNPRDSWEVRGVLLILVVLTGASAEAGWLLATMVSWPLLLTMLQRPAAAAVPQAVPKPIAKRKLSYPVRRYQMTG